MADAKQITVLIVDDDEVFRELTSRRLRAQRYRVRQAANWSEANREIKNDVDVVLMDLHMNSVDGDQLAPVLKKHHPELVMLLVSADDEDVLRRVAAKSKFDGYVTKSAGARELLKAIQHVLHPAAQDRSA